jgi:ketosteroid isomerase-like protein
MRSRFILSIAVAMGALSLGCAKSTTTTDTGAAPTSGNDEAGRQALSQLEDGWAKALETHDTTFFVRVVAPDFHGTADSANTFGRAEVIRDAGDTATVTRDVQDQDRQIRIYGNGTVGVVTGHSTWTVEKGQRPGQYSGRYTETWVKQSDGKWQAVAGHYSMASTAGQSQ